MCATAYSANSSGSIWPRARGRSGRIGMPGESPIWPDVRRCRTAWVLWSLLLLNPASECCSGWLWMAWPGNVQLLRASGIGELLQPPTSAPTICGDTISTASIRLRTWSRSTDAAALRPRRSDPVQLESTAGEWPPRKLLLLWAMGTPPRRLAAGDAGSEGLRGISVSLTTADIRRQMVGLSGLNASTNCSIETSAPCCCCCSAQGLPAPAHV
ncbi:hypothetical protein BX667DRAFT_380977 [Coemansia mojavensis]|nr:hypothetical protein BX667DRAFT_380977 [Coemansia mojavensis]